MKPIDWSAFSVLDVDFDGRDDFLQWLDALRLAIEGKRPELLASLFEDERVPPPQLAPLVARVILRHKLPQRSGRPLSVAALHTEVVQLQYALERQRGRSDEDARASVAERWGVSPDTVKRLL